MDDKEDEPVKDYSGSARVGASVNVKTRQVVKDVEDNTCSLILLPTTPAGFSEILNFAFEKLRRESKDVWEPPIKRGNILCMQTQAGLLMMQVFQMVGSVTYQPRRETPSVSQNFEKEVFSSCQCHNSFKILEDILRSGKFQFLIFRNCHGKTDLSIGTVTKPISSEEFRILDTILMDTRSYKDTTDDLIYKHFKLDEIGDIPPAGINGIKIDDDFLKELNEIKYQSRISVGKIRESKEKICGKIMQNGFDKNSEQASQGEASTSRDVISTQGTGQSRNSDSLVDHSYSLPTLLRCISQQLVVADWEKLRHIFKYRVSGRALENIENGVELFEEFVNRGFISHGNLEFLRDSFYDINRIDVVHLIDCVKEGDCSLLNEERIPGRNRSQNTSRNDNLPPQIQNLTLNANPKISHPQTSRTPVTVATKGTNTPSSNDVILPCKFSDAPKGSSSYPVQENVTDNHAVVNNSDFGAINGGNNTTKTSATCHEHTTSDSDSPHVIQAKRPDGNTSTEEQRSGSETTVVEKPLFSCEHYERQCDVQFSCCEKFWPCHRCHNSESSCETRKLRSRDIKNVKCKQCGKVQEFPKETPHCVECNLKFAEYFCCVCQHLTGTQSHPYHCENCGICRVHGDRSFHCDVCGVCLDVKLQNNHKCREGSAHDECCICFEDAFTGCQILPCSHKVHKDCASLMLRNGITKCPICRESFEHRIERRTKEIESFKKLKPNSKGN